MRQDTLCDDATKTKPDGGYVEVSTFLLGLLWWAFSSKLISLRAVRVGIALLELRTRRIAHALGERKNGNRPQRPPRFTTKEIAKLCGLPQKRVAHALGELLDLGILAEFSPELIRFTRSLAELAISEQKRAEFSEWLWKLTQRPRVPIPRRILVLACESSGPALIAFILGACLRCCWRKKDQQGAYAFTYSGYLSCTWLAVHFGLSLRAIQTAKEHLVGLQWLQRRDKVGRFGELVAINPHWHRLISLPKRETFQNQGPRTTGRTTQNQSQSSGAGEARPPKSSTANHPSAPIDGTKSAGVGPQNGTKSAGFSLRENLLPSEESKDQRDSLGCRPENPFGPGINFNPLRGERENPQPACEAARPVPSAPVPPTQAPGLTPPTPPRLSRIVPELDFKDMGRLLELFRQAVKCGLMPNDSEHSRLLWVAAAERARTGLDVINPAAVFLFLVKNRKWNYLSEGHFDAANARLKAYLFAPPEPGTVPVLGSVGRLAASTSPPSPATPSRPRLSKDALTLQVLRNNGMRNLETAFPLLRSNYGWDRPRFASALEELGLRRPATASVG